MYQSDFIAERECRERLAGEKEQLAEDLRRLHRRNRELQDQQNSMYVSGIPELHLLLQYTIFFRPFLDSM